MAMESVSNHCHVSAIFPPNTQGYVKDEAEGSLRIHVFMASVPADGEDLEFAEAFGMSQLGGWVGVKKVQAFWGGLKDPIYVGGLEGTENREEKWEVFFFEDMLGLGWF